MASVTQLGYLAFEVADLAAWETFVTRVLGLGIAARTARGGLVLRMDGRAARIFVEPGPADDLAAIGWEAADERALDTIVERLRAAGFEVAAGTAEEASARRVAKLVKLTDPGGIPSELFVGAERAAEPFRSDVVRSGFVGDEHGLGHLVVTARTQEESEAFYTKLLGFRLSDYIRCEVHGYPVDIAFFHANGRHHSVAFGARQKKRLHHFMLEARSMDEVGLAYDRTLAAGLRIMQTLGRHPNDRMFSFYAKTPSGFQFEFGWGGREIDDATWRPTTYDRISEWGHHPPELLVARKERP